MSKKDKRPNVLLVYPDQMRYDCTSLAGNPTVKTPHIDALATEGVMFDSAFSSYPLCCPFRASLMTGVYAHEHGMLTNHYPIRLGQTVLPELMNEAGYRTGWFGKWHLNGGNKFDHVSKPLRLGFQEFVGFSRGHDYLNGTYYRNDDPQPYRSDKYEPEYQTDHVIEFMTESLEREEPFMAMICYGLPHDPVDSAPDYYKHMYSPDDVVLPDTIPVDMREHEKAYRAMYYGLVSCVDDQIKRLTDWLKEAGIEEDTLVIFVSDHGDLNGEHGLRYKSSFYDASMHVPLIIRYPQISEGGIRVDQMVDASIDVMPTILDICDVPVPEHLRGKSLRKLISTGADEERNNHVYYQLPRTGRKAAKVLDRQERKFYGERGIRTNDFVYVEKEGIPFALFDLKRDPGEKTNFINSIEYLEVIEDYRKWLATIMEDVGDSWDIEVEDGPPDYLTHEENKAWVAAIHKRAIIEQR
jgi:arylsulfatase A-like enzyme